MLSPLLSVGQKKGDNTIVVDTLVQSSRLKSILFQNGLTQINSDSFLIATSDKEMPRLSYLKLNILKTDTAIYIKGMLRIPGLAILFGNDIGKDYNPVAYYKAKGSYVRDAWDEMNRIALLFGSKVRYLKQ